MAAVVGQMVAVPSLAEPWSSGTAGWLTAQVWLCSIPSCQHKSTHTQVVLRGSEGAPDKSGKARWLLCGSCLLKIKGLLK